VARFRGEGDHERTPALLEDEAWGVITRARHRAIAARCLDEVVVPRFRRLGALR
jgi:hypothetical protein